MRTNIKIVSDVNQEPLRKGDIGYIDGYVQGADNRPYAVVVIPTTDVIAMCPINQLQFTGIE
jgi:hypothetical protein